MPKDKTKFELQVELEAAQKRVTELEETLKNSQGNQDFARIFRASPSQMALTDQSTGQYVEINDSFVNSLGFTREEVIGKTATELKIFVDPEQRQKLLLRMRDQGYLRNEYVLVRAKSGAIRQGIFSAEFINTNDQTMLLTVMNDVTDRLEAEQRWQFALEGANEGVWDWNLQTNKVFYSRHWKAMLGFKEDEIGDTLDEWSQRVHPDDLPGVMEEVNKHLLGAVPVYISEHRIRCKDATYKWVLDSGKVMEWSEDKKPLRVIGTHKDISERKRLEQVLEGEAVRRRVLFEESPDGILIIDVSTATFLEFNSRAAEQLGYTREEFSKLRIFDVEAQETAEETRIHIENVVKNGRSDFETLHRTKQGEIRNIHVTAMSVTILGAPVYYCIWRDITERKQSEMALRDSEKQLRSMLEISQAMSAPLEMDLILQKVVENATGLLKLDSGAIYTLRGEELFLEATTPPLPPQFPNELRRAHVSDHPHIHAAVSSGSIVILPDSKATELSAAERIVVDSRGLRSVAYIPLMISEKAIGVLIVASVNRLRTFSADEITMYTGFSGQAAQTIENVRLYKAEYEYAVELEAQIAERKQAEATLRESERKYRDLINGMNETVWVIDTDMSFLDVNDAAVKALGYSRAELLSMKVSDIDSAIAPEQIQQLIDRLSVEKLQVFETRHMTKDGREIPIEISSSSISYMGRSVIMSIARDITDRKRAEKEVRRRNEDVLLINTLNDAANRGENLANILNILIQNAHTMFDCQGLSVYLLSEDGKYAELQNLTLTPERVELIEKLIGRAIPRVQVPIREGGYFHQLLANEQGTLIDDANKIRQWINEFVETPTLPDVVRPLVRKMVPQIQKVIAIRTIFSMPLIFSGRKIGLIELSSHSSFSEDDLLRIRTISRQMTAIILRLWATERLKESEQKYRALYNEMPIGVLLVNVRGEILDANPAILQILGSPSLEATRQINLLTFAPLIESGLSSDFKKTVDLEQINRVERHYFTKWGKSVHLYVTFVPVITPQQELVIQVLIEDITARKEAENNLRTSEEKYRGLLESLDTVVANVDLNGRFLYMNDTAAGQLGSVPAQLIGKTMYDLFPEHVAQIQMRDIKNTAEADKGMAVENPSMINGKPRWYRTSFQPLHDENGRVVSVLVNSTDIHELKTVQQELQELNRTLEERVQVRTAEVRDLYDNAPAGYHSLDANGRLISVNETEAHWLGYTPDELIGHSVVEMLTPNSLQDFEKVFSELKRKGVIDNWEIEVVRKDGTTFPVMINAKAVYDENGQFLSSRSSMVDITERKKAENELKRNINFTSALLNAVPTPVFYKDRAGRYLGCNHAFVELMGKTPAEIQGKLPHEVWNETQADLYRQKDLELMQANERQFYEALVTDKNDIAHPVIFVKDLFYDEGGNVAGLVGAFIDISERKAAEESLRKINKELEYALRVKDEFLANMSHELRTPLNGILGFSEILLDKDFGVLNERQLKYVSSIESSGKHLLGLINDLLDLAKIQAGKFELYPENVIISELCQSSLVFVKQMAHMKNIQLSFENETTFPFIIGDQRRLKQILVNLLSNAVKFTPKNGTVILRAASDRLNHCIKFSVQDNGIGISAEDLQNLFTPFTQLDNSLTRQHEGTGLGLALVQKLAELHGGDVTVQSEVGKGSTFTVSIPEAHEAGFEEKKIPQFAAGGAEARANTKPGTKIMLAEDIDSNIVILGDYLESKAYQMIYARNGEEALEKAKETLPDLILMDIQMPVMDGLEATRRLRGDPRFASVPIIALTALAMRGDRERCLAAGATEYVSKPVNLKQLDAMITHLLENK